MASLNRVYLLGNLTRDPEVRYAPSGSAVADLRMAVSRRYKTASGEEKEETCFVSVAVWGKQGESCGEYLSKGSPLLVEGRLRYEEWEKDGQKNNRLSVVAERVQFIGAPRRSEPRDGSPDEAESRDEPAPRPAPVNRASANRAPAAPAAPAAAPAGGRSDDDDLPF
jgi:single-strand DNA-binding protein